MISPFFFSPLWDSLIFLKSMILKNPIILIFNSLGILFSFFFQKSGEIEVQWFSHWQQVHLFFFSPFSHSDIGHDANLQYAGTFNYHLPLWIFFKSLFVWIFLKMMCRLCCHFVPFSCQVNLGLPKLLCSRTQEDIRFFSLRKAKP
jgi:hypothetical protein